MSQLKLKHALLAISIGIIVIATGLWFNHTQTANAEFVCPDQECIEEACTENDKLTKEECDGYLGDEIEWQGWTQGGEPWSGLDENDNQTMNTICIHCHGSEANLEMYWQSYQRLGFSKPENSPPNGLIYSGEMIASKEFAIACPGVNGVVGESFGAWGREGGKCYLDPRPDPGAQPTIARVCNTYTNSAGKKFQAHVCLGKDMTEEGGDNNSNRAVCCNPPATKIVIDKDGNKEEVAFNASDVCGTDDNGAPFCNEGCDDTHIEVDCPSGAQSSGSATKSQGDKPDTFCPYIKADPGIKVCANMCEGAKFDPITQLCCYQGKIDKITKEPIEFLKDRCVYDPEDPDNLKNPDENGNCRPINLGRDAGDDGDIKDVTCPSRQASDDCCSSAENLINIKQARCLAKKGFCPTYINNGCHKGTTHYEGIGIDIPPGLTDSIATECGLKKCERNDFSPGCCTPEPIVGDISHYHCKLTS